MKKTFPLQYKLFAIAVVLLVCQIIFLTLSGEFHALVTEEVGRFSDGKYYVYLILASAVFCVLLSIDFFKGLGPITVFVVWGILQAIQLFFAGQDVILYIRQLSWVFVLYFLYLTAKKYGADYFFKMFFLLLSALLIYAITRIVVIRTQSDYEGSFNIIYWVLLGLPFGFVAKERWQKTVFLGLVVFLAFISLKSTAIVAVSTSLLVAYYIDNFYYKNRKGGFLFIIILALIVLVPDVITNLEGSLNLNWSEKTVNAFDEGGSGRLWIWGATLDLVFSSSPRALLLGHGHNTLVNVLHFSAHNDFLEVLYDYGLIMFIVYCGLFVRLYKEAKNMVRIKYQYATAFATSVMVFFSVSMFSHLMIYPGLMLILGAFWGLCIGDFEYSMKHLT